MPKFTEKKLTLAGLLNQTPQNIFKPRAQVTFNDNPFLNNDSALNPSHPGQSSLAESYIGALPEGVRDDRRNYSSLQLFDEGGVPISRVFNNGSARTGGTADRSGHAEKLNIENFAHEFITDRRALPRGIPSRFEYQQGEPHSITNLRRPGSPIPTAGNRSTQRKYNILPKGEDLNRQNSYLNPIQQVLEREKNKMGLLTDRSTCNIDPNKGTPTMVNCRPFLNQVMPTGSHVGYFFENADQPSSISLGSRRDGLKNKLKFANEQIDLRNGDQGLNDELDYYMQMVGKDNTAPEIPEPLNLQNLETTRDNYLKRQQQEEERLAELQYYRELVGNDHNAPRLDDRASLGLIKQALNSYQDNIINPPQPTKKVRLAPPVIKSDSGENDSVASSDINSGELIRKTGKKNSKKTDKKDRFAHGGYVTSSPVLFNF